MADPVVAEVETFYRAYMEAFNGRDEDGFARSFGSPCALLFGNALAVLATETDVRSFFGNAMAGLQAAGWTRSSVSRVQVWPFSEVLASVVADIHRHGQDDAVFDSGRAVYTVGRSEDGWRILTLTEMKSPYAEQAITIGS